MRGITVRFSNTTYAQVAQEAKNEAISITAFIREATVIRMVLMKARRGDYGDIGPDHELVHAVRKIIEREREREEES